MGLAAAGLTAQLPLLAQAAKNYTFGSASAKGSWYPLAVAMSKVINDNVPGTNVTGVTTPGASRENILRIDRAGNGTRRGLPPISCTRDIRAWIPLKPNRKVLGWFAAYPGYFTIAARKAAGIKTIADSERQKGRHRHAGIANP